MSVSLLARQMFLPASMAATVGGKPAQPTIPVEESNPRDAQPPRYRARGT